MGVKEYVSTSSRCHIAKWEAVVLIEAYFDESGTHDGSPVMVIGGFLIESEEARKLELAWKVMLDRYGIEFFHMTDCALGF